MIFIIVALLLLLAAVWMGLTLATHISRPISGLDCGSGTSDTVISRCA